MKNIVNKLFSSIRKMLGFPVSRVESMPVTSSLFEIALAHSKETGVHTPIWELFVNTEFFVIILKLDNEPVVKDFRFSVFNNPVDNKPYVLVSEYVELLDNAQSSKAIKIKGAKLIELLQPELGVVVKGHEDGAFCIPNDLVQWLRDSIQEN